MVCESGRVREDVEFATRDARLSGTISWPDALVPVPGVVLIGGSGPADRHNGGLFDALRDHLVDAGVAVLSYDKRGVGGSTGAWSTATVDGLGSDAGAAVAVLRRHPRVAKNKVGVLGHSEGGWVALRLCAQLGGIRHLIVNSCPATSFLAAEVFSLTSGRCRGQCGLADVPPDERSRARGRRGRGGAAHLGQLPAPGLVPVGAGRIRADR